MFQLLIQLVYRFGSAVRQIDQVGLRVVREGDGHGIFPIHTTERGFFLQVEKDRTDIFQQHRAGGDDDVLQVAHCRIE